MNDAVSYDALLEAGREAPVPCPVCTGDEHAPPCGEECDALIKRCHRERVIRGHYQDARRALRFARRYYTEGGPREGRLAAVMHRIQCLRVDIAALRSA